VAGGFGASNKVTFQNLNTLQSTETDNPMGTPIYAAITYKPIEKLSVGFSFSTPFGSTINGLITGKEKKWYRKWN
jgi:long-chain fatty acid transport protein